MIKLKLNTFDAEGNVTGEREVELSVEAIQDIIDHAAQFVVLRRAGFERSEVDVPSPEEDQAADELEEALTARDIVKDDE